MCWSAGPRMNFIYFLFLHRSISSRTFFETSKLRENFEKEQGKGLPETIEIEVGEIYGEENTEGITILKWKKK